jgi:excisionase family DNA binding protein
MGRRQLETLESAAARLAVDQRTIRRRIADGTITGYRVAGRKAIRVDPVEVDDKLMQPIPAVEQFA